MDPLDAISQESLAEFCGRWKVVEIAIFGSVVRDDFRVAGDNPSDIDVLITYAPDARISLLDEVRMQHELSNIMARKVDMISRRAIEQSHNSARRNEILSTAKVLYAA